MDLKGSKQVDNITSPIYLSLCIIIAIALYRFLKQQVIINAILLVAIPLHTTLAKKKLKTLMKVEESNVYELFMNLVCWVAAFTLLFSRNINIVENYIGNLEEYNKTLADIADFVGIILWIVLCFYSPYKTKGDTGEIAKTVWKKMKAEKEQ